MASSSSSTGLPKLSVLVVDDEAMMRKIHSVFFKKYGFETTTAENGQEAVNLHHSGLRFHLVLMDMDMPVMNGPMATKELRAMGVSSMIVGLTSRDQGSERDKFMKSGLDDFYIKPLNSNVVCSLAETLAKKNSG